MSIKIFVNLPVKDLKKSMEFFTGLGFSFNPQFTDENAACLVFSDSIYAMLLTEKFFKTFVTKEIADTTKTIEVINALFLDSRKEVDELVDKALKAGAGKYREPDEMDFMYSRSFSDLDGHLWEVGYMDPNHVQ
jgi:predicted lactoylglutathione lyase